jgi:Tetracyclin repressor-like, C-terminal domain
VSVQDAYIYGFALQEKDVPFETAEESAEVAARQGWDDEALGKEFPNLAEVVAGHVAKVGYDFTEAFEYGLDLILDALEQRRDAA